MTGVPVAGCPTRFARDAYVVPVVPFWHEKSCVSEGADNVSHHGPPSVILARHNHEACSVSVPSDQVNLDDASAGKRGHTHRGAGRQPVGYKISGIDPIERGIVSLEMNQALRAGSPGRGTVVRWPVLAAFASPLFDRFRSSPAMMG